MMDVERPRGGNGSVVLRRARPRMGTLVAITVRGRDRDLLERLVREMFAEMERLERILSEWDGASALSAINREAGRAPVEVPPELIAVAQTASRVSVATAGAYDSTWLPLADCWRFRGSQHDLPDPRELAARRALVDYREVATDLSKGTVFLRRAGMRLGFGGVAKAYIAERAAEVATRAGIRDVLVDAGGDVVARGTNGDRPWTVAVRHPRVAGAALALVELHDQSIATSGDYESFCVIDGRRYSHILDPRTGYPAGEAQSVTVIAPDGAFADAFSTGLFVLGARRGLDTARAAPDVSALIVDEDGTVHVSGAANRFEVVEEGVAS